MHTWDGFDADRIELHRLTEMNQYQRVAYVRQEDYLRAKFELSQTRDALHQASYNQRLFSTLAKRHLKRYAESNSEEEWSIAQDYLGLAQYEHESKQLLRDSLLKKQNTVREARVLWQKQQKLAELQSRMEHKQN